MKRIVTLVLMMLVGGYGAARAQTPMEMETATQMEEATKDFLGLKWGLGIGVMGGFGGGTAVEKASVVGTDKIVRVDEEGDMRPQMFLEMHVLLVDLDGKMENWRNYKQKKANYWRKKDGAGPPTLQEDEAPLRGFGPFIALQGDDDKVIDALAVGVMWGFRRDAKATNSVNVGVGLSFDPSVQVLGHGIKEGRKLPEGETEVRFKKEGRFGWALMASFTF